MDAALASPPPLLEAAADLADSLLLLARATAAHAASALSAAPPSALLLVAAACCGAALALALALASLCARLLSALGLARPPASYAQLVPAHRAQTALAGRALAVARRLPGLRGAVARAQADLRAEMEKSIRPPAGAPPAGAPLARLPERPTPHADVLAMVRARESRGPRLPTNGRAPFSGALYVRDPEHVALMNRVAAAASLYSNPLHGPGMFPAVRQMEAEVVAMTAGLLGGGGGGAGDDAAPRSTVCGLMTSGGTESIVTALKAARDHAVATRGASAFAGGPPEVVASPAAHAAVIKAAEWLGLRIAWAEADADGRLRGPAVRRAIGPRTVCVYASAPSYPWGVVDDVRGIAAVARRWGVGVHVDACLGGFVLPFLDDGGGDDDDDDQADGGGDASSLPPASPYASPGAWGFSVPGVASLSVDTHKYALAPKGSSVLLFAGPRLRRHCYTSVTDWPGGVYVSPSLAGSRSGALVATAWASLVSLGRQGLRASARRAAAAAREFARRLPEEVPELEVLPARGPGVAARGGGAGSAAFVPDTTVVAWRVRGGGGGGSGSIYRINDRMEARGGWRLSALQRPPALHFCFTDASAGVVDALLADLKACVAAEGAPAAAAAAGKGGGGSGGNKAAAATGSAPLYGACAVVPDRSVVGEALEVVQDVLLGL